ncbi:MAG: hypothetical protein U1E23_09620 [Reyranellaceae bacterium]
MPNKDQVAAALRHVYTATGAIVAMLVALGALGQGDADKVVSLVQQIGGGVAVVVGAIAALVPIVSAARAAWSASHAQQIRKVESLPGVEVIRVDTTAAPQVAVDAALDATRPKVKPEP